MALNNLALQQALGIKGAEIIQTTDTIALTAVVADISGFSAPPINARGFASAGVGPAAGMNGTFQLHARTRGGTEIIGLQTDSPVNIHLGNFGSPFIGGAPAVGDQTSFGGLPLLNDWRFANVLAATLVPFFAVVPEVSPELAVALAGVRWFVPPGQFFTMTGGTNQPITAGVIWRELAQQNFPE